MATRIHAQHIASITELKRDPTGTAQAGGGEPVAILVRNEAVFYCVPAGTFERMIGVGAGASKDTRGGE